MKTAIVAFGGVNLSIGFLCGLMEWTAFFNACVLVYIVGVVVTLKHWDNELRG